MVLIKFQMNFDEESGVTLKAFLSASLFLAGVGIMQAQAETAKQTIHYTSTKPELSARGIYFAARGYGSIEDQNNFHFDNSREIAFAVGTRPYENIRFELEYGVRWSDISGLNGALAVKGDASVQSLGLHAFYDFRNGKKLRPFLGAGVGGAILDFEFAGPTNHNPNFIVVGDDTNLSHYFNYFAGATYHINPKLRLGMGVEYVTLKDDAIESNIGGIMGINRSYNYFVGVRYFFASKH